MDSPTTPRRVRLLGGAVDLVAPADMLRFVELMADMGEPAVIANHNSRSLFLQRRSPALRAFYDEADLIQVDSAALIAWGRLLGLPLRRALRSTYRDWREDFWNLAHERKWRVFYVGGAPGLADGAARKLTERWPGAAIAVHSGLFDSAPGSRENRAVLDRIRAFDPDIIFVGLGKPRQEAWVRENRSALSRGVIFTVGAAFEQEAGARTGQFVARIRRLATRYLIEPWALLGLALGDVSDAFARAASNPDRRHTA